MRYIFSSVLIVVSLSLSSVCNAEIYRISFYDSCVTCCGKTDGITASGRKAKVGTIAVDRKLIPLGSKVWIDGIGECSADDVGGAIKGKRIDVWVESHEEALRLGVVYREVKILKSVNRKQ